MQKLGLALCGGGAKGSYEAGCFKAFRELGITFNVVTGTSIGCLNGAMYCQHEEDRAIELWNRITANMIIKYGFNFDRLDVLKGFKNDKNSLTFLFQYLTNRGSDVGPLKKLFKQYINTQKIINSDVDFGIVTAEFPQMKGVEVLANKLDEELIEQYILASASAWPVFPVCKILDKQYVDGGYYDNLPINYAFKLGSDHVVAIDLNYDAMHKEYLNVDFVRYIRPKHSLGSFMKFEHDLIMSNMDLGYLDTMKSYGKLKGFRQAFFLDSFDFNTDSYKDRIIDVYSQLNKNYAKYLKKKENEITIFDALKEYTDNVPLNGEIMFIRSLEILAENFDISFYKAYNIKEFIKIVLTNLDKLTINEELVKQLEKCKKAEKKFDIINRVNNLDVLSLYYNEIKTNNHLNIATIALIYSTKIEICISLLVLEYIFKEVSLDD